MFLKNIYLKTLRDMRNAFLWWAGSLFVLNVWMVSFFPAISELGGIDELMGAMPDYMMDLFGDMAAMGTLAGFLSVELMSFFMPLLFMIFAIHFGSNIISAEEESNSLDLLLSQPIPRWQVTAEKFAAIVTFTTLVALASWLGLFVGTLVMDVDATGVELFAGMLVHIPFAIFFAGMALCITGLKAGRGLATGVSAGFGIATYFSSIMQSVANLPEWTQYFSPWYYFDGQNVLYDGVNWGLALPLLAAGLALAILGMWGFTQRDLGT